MERSEGVGRGPHFLVAMATRAPQRSRIFLAASRACAARVSVLSRETPKILMLSRYSIGVPQIEMGGRSLALFSAGWVVMNRVSALSWAIDM